jgi:hypothetical protein
MNYTANTVDSSGYSLPTNSRPAEYEGRGYVVITFFRE